MTAFQRPEITFKARSAGKAGNFLMVAAILTNWSVYHERVGSATLEGTPNYEAMNSPARMKAVQLARFGNPEVLEIVDLPVPYPGPGDVRARIRAAGVNFF